MPCAAAGIPHLDTSRSASCGALTRTTCRRARPTAVHSEFTLVLDPVVASRAISTHSTAVNAFFVTVLLTIRAHGSTSVALPTTVDADLILVANPIPASRARVTRPPASRISISVFEDTCRTLRCITVAWTKRRQLALYNLLVRQPFPTTSRRQPRPSSPAIDLAGSCGRHDPQSSTPRYICGAIKAFECIGLTDLRVIAIDGEHGVRRR